ncbi:MAG TPA: hypothetical protein VFT46_11410 [Holophagaceae bacterium]|nr:hypothetical protein [Holophagaceae bacterium]
MPEAAVEPSIHWRQRWWYVLWVSLLLTSLGFWAWWETPAARGTGHVVLKLWVVGLPEGSRVSAWAGPQGAGPAEAAFQGPWVVADPAKPLPIPPLEIQAALRRWHQGYIPRLTTASLLIRIQPAQGPARYLGYDLRHDLDSGAAGPHRRLFISGPVRWDTLSVDATHPSPLLP